MARGPAGGPRPLVKTSIKYDVVIRVKEETYYDPPKARDLLNMRVNTPQDDSNEFLKDKVGRIIMAVNNMAHPSRYHLIDESVEFSGGPSGIAKGDIEATWTYILEGSGMAKGWRSMTTTSAMHKLHEVLVKENDEPIKNSRAQREWNPSPYNVQRVKIGCD